MVLHRSRDVDHGEQDEHQGLDEGHEYAEQDKWDGDDGGHQMEEDAAHLVVPEDVAKKTEREGDRTHEDGDNFNQADTKEKHEQEKKFRGLMAKVTSMI